MFQPAPALLQCSFSLRNAVRVSGSRTRPGCMPTTRPTVFRSFAASASGSVPPQPAPAPKGNYIFYILGALGAVVLAGDAMLVWEERGKPKKNILLENEFSACQLVGVIPVTHDTSLYRIRAKSPDAALLSVPFHVVVKDDSCQVARSSARQA
ncbi:hypothetical protein HDU91_000752 [Kappamyces sp. JEL0680]|nr:hypothetical protein HDU91_000752 [Kappamyces sp. JEL0680]